MRQRRMECKYSQTRSLTLQCLAYLNKSPSPDPVDFVLEDEGTRPKPHYWVIHAVCNQGVYGKQMQMMRLSHKQG